MRLSVFLPFHNEEENIRSATDAVSHVLTTIREITDFEVIIVNDGSTDRTREIAEEIAAGDPRIRLVHHRLNKGYGAAVMSGIESARFEYVFFTDGDLQFDIGEIKKLLPWVPEYKIIIGFRNPRKDNHLRLLNAFLWNIFIRTVFGLKVRDIDCAFKLFKTEAVSDLPMISGGAMFSAELLIRLKRSGLAFKEVPVKHLPRQLGHSSGAKPHVIMRALKDSWLVYRDLYFKHE